MDWLDGLGWFGSGLLIFSLLQSRVLRFRILNLCASSVLTAFNAVLQIWPMVAMNVVLAGINLFFLRRLLAERHDEKAFEVVEVEPGDAYLRHVLKVHGSDIVKFQPDFVWEPGSGACNSYLVLHGDETVGVVLVRDAGNGVAQVVLDYATPRFRDFSVGEFVWRRSGLLRECGYTTVVTPERMVAPYYSKIGFERTEGSYTLTL